MFILLDSEQLDRLSSIGTTINIFLRKKFRKTNSHFFFNLKSSVVGDIISFVFLRMETTHRSIIYSTAIYVFDGVLCLFLSFVLIHCYSVSVFLTNIKPTIYIYTFDFIIDRDLNTLVILIQIQKQKKKFSSFHFFLLFCCSSMCMCKLLSSCTQFIAGSIKQNLNTFVSFFFLSFRLFVRTNNIHQK